MGGAPCSYAHSQTGSSFRPGCLRLDWPLTLLSEAGASLLAGSSTVSEAAPEACIGTRQRYQTAAHSSPAAGMTPPGVHIGCRNATISKHFVRQRLKTITIRLANLIRLSKISYFVPNSLTRLGWS